MTVSISIFCPARSHYQPCRAIFRDSSFDIGVIINTVLPFLAMESRKRADPLLKRIDSESIPKRFWFPHLWESTQPYMRPSFIRRISPFASYARASLGDAWSVKFNSDNCTFDVQYQITQQQECSRVTWNVQILRAVNPADDFLLTHVLNKSVR